MTDDQAETLALRALAWMAVDDDILGGFLMQSGVAASELRARAGDRDVPTGVMAYLLAEDARILAGAAALGVAPEALAAAARQLAGEVPHWT